MPFSILTLLGAAGGFNKRHRFSMILSAISVAGISPSIDSFDEIAAHMKRPRATIHRWITDALEEMVQE
jgi:hypothetical protein